jgi:hypothetical protein
MFAQQQKPSTVPGLLEKSIILREFFKRVHIGPKRFSLVTFAVFYGLPALASQLEHTLVDRRPIERLAATYGLPAWAAWLSNRRRPIVFSADLLTDGVGLVLSIGVAVGADTVLYGARVADRLATDLRQRCANKDAFGAMVKTIGGIMGNPLVRLFAAAWGCAPVISIRNLCYSGTPGWWATVPTAMPVSWPAY